jgi:hypothetical protein
LLLQFAPEPRGSLVIETILLEQRPHFRNTAAGCAAFLAGGEVALDFDVVQQIELAIGKSVKERAGVLAIHGRSPVLWDIRR